jgi:sec-independent protein translocase protein TatA
MFGLGTKELIIIAGIVILLFGAKKLPELAKAIGQSVRLIRGGFNEDETTDQKKSS